MKVLKSLFLCVGTVLLALNFTACTDWGDADPEAGNQTYPDRSVVSTYAFDYGADDVYLGDITDKADVCEAVEDADLGSNVLHLDANGYAVMANPFNGVKLQNGAAITFWLKTAGIPQEVAEGEEPAVEDDLTGAVLAFGSGEAGAERFYLTANGQLRYTKPGNLESLNLNENDPATYKTGILPAGGWHFVALQISEEGYQLYVDGNKSLSGATPSGVESTTFSYKTLIDFLNTAPNIYIGKGAGDDDVNMSEMWVDDVKLIRNQMIASDWAMPNKGGGGAGDEDIDLSKYTYIVGNENNTDAFFTAFTDYITIPAGQEARLKFINYTSGIENWHNFITVCTTDADRAATQDPAGYWEYFVLRADNYGWGNGYDAANLVSDYNWDTFKSDMDGALVDLTVRRVGAEVYYTSVVTTTTGSVYTMTYHQTCGNAEDNIRIFLTTESGHMAFNPDECKVVLPQNVSTVNVGAEDNSNAWWSAWSDYFAIPANKTLELNFENHTSGINNWNNWNLVLTTDADRGAAAGYAEYFVLRCDNYGWGDTNYNAANITLENYPIVGSETEQEDWAAFRQNMEGAKVKITIQRAADIINVTAVATCPNGTVYTERYSQTCGDGTQTVRAFLATDGSHFIMDANNCYLVEPCFE